MIHGRPNQALPLILVLILGLIVLSGFGCPDDDVPTIPDDGGPSGAHATLDVIRRAILAHSSTNATTPAHSADSTTQTSLHAPINQGDFVTTHTQFQGLNVGGTVNTVILSQGYHANLNVQYPPLHPGADSGFYCAAEIGTETSAFMGGLPGPGLRTLGTTDADVEIEFSTSGGKYLSLKNSTVVFRGTNGTARWVLFR
jgi:hypothetical protein